MPRAAPLPPNRPDGPPTAGRGFGLVIPARNEVAGIPALAEAVRPLLAADLVQRVVVVDNGSNDGTGPAAAAAGFDVVQEPRPGYGGACLAGIAHLRRAVPGLCAIGFLDADLADDPAQLPALATPVLAGVADLALGQRAARAAAGALSGHQRFGNALATGLMGLATGHRYRDLGPMRVLSLAALDSLGMTDTTWGWTIEMQHKAATRGLRVVELDVPYRARTTGKSKISGSLLGSARAGTVILRTIGQLWWTERRRA